MEIASFLKVIKSKKTYHPQITTTLLKNLLILINLNRLKLKLINLYIINN